MEIRRLKQEDLYAAGVVSHIAFHGRTEDLEEKRREWEANPEEEDWGAFTDDGQMMARIINNHFESRLDGAVIRSGGIGAVSTLPEYRESGAVREIFRALLPQARANGEVLSTLYPFLHGFYRKFGYETVSARTKFRLTPAQLAGHVHTGWVRQWKPEDEIGVYTGIYARFAQNLNLSHVRDDERMKKSHIGGTFYKDRRFVYLLGRGTEATAYIDLLDEFHPEGAHMIVREAAWTCPDGFRSILGFLARFTADYLSMEISLPTELDLRLHVRNPYEVAMNPQCNHMVRVVNAEKLLSLIHMPQDSAFTVTVYGDEQIPENNGTWHVAAGQVTPEPEAACDLRVSIRALGQMGTGAVSLREAMLREDVTVCGNFDVLSQIFRSKPIYVGDEF